VVGEARADSRPRFFNPDEYATLEALVDRLIPPDTNPAGLASPGAKAAGVADYIDFLLGAFLSSSPFIFAGGPFSNRNPVDGQGLTDDMAHPTSKAIASRWVTRPLTRKLRCRSKTPIIPSPLPTRAITTT
jgi:hypothetical protein